MALQRTLEAFIVAVGSGEVFKKPLSYMQSRVFSEQAGRANILLLRRSFDASLTAIRILSREKEKLQKEIDNYTRDKLTGLFNRHGLEFRLSNLTQSESSEYAVILLDLDGFKNVNDTLGHDAGDAILQAVARRLSGEETGKRGFKKDDIIVRQGGDEFLVVMSVKTGSVFDEQKVKLRINTMLRGLYAYQDEGKKILPLCASVGIARHKGCLNMDVFDALVKEADAKAYEDKKTKPLRLEAAECFILEAMRTDKAPEPAFVG